MIDATGEKARNPRSLAICVVVATKATTGRGIDEKQGRFKVGVRRGFT